MEGLLEVLGAEAEVLVIAADPLAVEVDVEQLARPQRLPHPVREREPGHRLVRHLGVDAHHLGAVQHGDEVQCVAHGGQEDVAAGLVGLGLDGELQRVPLLDHVVRQQVDRLAVALERVTRVLGHAHLGALAPAPEHVDLGAELGPEIDREHRLADRRPAHAAVVGGEGAVLERRMAEQVGRRHPHAEPALTQGVLERSDDPVALGGRGAVGDEVVVVQAHAPGAGVGQAVDGVHGIARWSRRLAERVAPRIAHGPQPEGEPRAAPALCVRHR